MAQILKYAIILSLALPMFFMVIVAAFSVIVVVLDTAFHER